jgi:putative ABC transport system permease protein
MLGMRDGARAGIVVSEVALAIMLLASAGLVARSLGRLLSVNVGFDTSHLLTLQVNSVGKAYNDNEQVFAFHERVREAVRAIPGVLEVGTASQLPLGGNMDRYGVNAEDKPLANPELAPSPDRYTVSADYLHAMRVPLLAGRVLTDADRDSTPKVAVVSASLAKRIWPGESALGKRIHVGGLESPARTVVGVVGDVRHSGLDAVETMQLYTPERQWFFSDNSVALVVRTKGDPSALAPVVRKTILALDPSQPVTAVASMEQVIAQSTAQRRLALGAFAIFALVALLLAAAGIYGVLAGSVTERTREIGLRSALGAAPRRILGLVVGRAVMMAALGSALGIAGAIAGTRFLRSLLYEVGATDPLTLAGVVIVLSAVTIVACVVPALRALRIDPMAALRAD